MRHSTRHLQLQHAAAAAISRLHLRGGRPSSSSSSGAFRSWTATPLLSPPASLVAVTRPTVIETSSAMVKTAILRAMAMVLDPAADDGDGPHWTGIASRSASALLMSAFEVGACASPVGASLSNLPD
ncbi:unnamed protein product [Lampetra planeri]